MRYWTGTERIKELLPYITVGVAVLALILSIVGITRAPSKATYNAGLEEIETAISQQIDDVQAAVNGQANRISSMEDRASDLEEDVANSIDANMPDIYLTGQFPNYTLHATGSQAGNYIANLVLAYPSPVWVGNTTTPEDALLAFYSGTDSTSPYLCDISYNSENLTWGISRVGLTTDVFTMSANEETVVDITLVGLNSTFAPVIAYVGVLPAVRE